MKRILPFMIVAGTSVAKANMLNATETVEVATGTSRTAIASFRAQYNVAQIDGECNIIHTSRSYPRSITSGSRFKIFGFKSEQLPNASLPELIDSFRERFGIDLTEKVKTVTEFVAVAKERYGVLVDLDREIFGVTVRLKSENTKACYILDCTSSKRLSLDQLLSVLYSSNAKLLPVTDL